MRQQVIDQFSRSYGAVSRRTEKILAWEARPDLGVIVFMDTPARGEYAKACVPCPPDLTDLPSNARRAHPDKRHSNTFASPGLRRGTPALYFWIRDAGELDETLRFISEMPPIRGGA